MNVILGKDVYLMINGEKFICAENVEFSGQMETKSVKTVGDKHYRRYKGQNVGYSVTVNGLIPYPSEGEELEGLTALDLSSYYKEMLPVTFQMVFDDQQGVSLEMIRGEALITELGFTGPADFAGGSLTLLGNGEPIFGLPPTCNKAIVDFNITNDGSVYSVSILTLNSGTVPRYDYKVDGRGVRTSFDTGWPIILIDQPYKPLIGPHSIEIWPVCENGIYGQKLTYNFEYPAALSCEAYINEVLIKVVGNSRTITILNQINAENYSWKYNTGNNLYTGSSGADEWTIDDHGIGRLEITPICANGVVGEAKNFLLAVGAAPSCLLEIESATSEIANNRRRITIESSTADFYLLDWDFYQDDPNDNNRYSGSVQTSLIGGVQQYIESFTIDPTGPGVLRITPYCDRTRKGSSYYLVIR